MSPNISLKNLPHQTLKNELIYKVGFRERERWPKVSKRAAFTGNCIDLNHFDDYYLLLFNKILAHVRGICISDSLSRVEQSKYKHYSRGEKVEFNKYRVFCLCL